MDQAHAEQLADELKAAVFKRTGIPPERLHCPRDRSDMTPCAARDGRLVATVNSRGHGVCVGCGQSLQLLMQHEIDQKR
jgi:hypothetical protein